VRRLLPDSAEIEVDEQYGALAMADLAPDGRPYVFANFAATVDGRATISGRSGPIGSDVDTRVLMLLRSVADAVMIGAGTMRAERYGRMVPDGDLRDRREAAGLARDPVAVLVTRTLDFPWEAGLFTSGEGSVVIYTSADSEAPETATPVDVVRHPETVDLAAMMADLRDRGIRALLTEGGPTILAELVEHRLVDELFLTIAPKLGGEPTAPTILEGPLTEPVAIDIEWLLEQDGELYARYRIRE
jgi:riboflavin-specific deaminase-like protein